MLGSILCLLALSYCFHRTISSYIWEYSGILFMLIFFFVCIATGESSNNPSSTISGTVTEWYVCPAYKLWFSNLILETQTFNAFQSENMELKVSKEGIMVLLAMCGKFWVMGHFNSNNIHNYVHPFVIILKVKNCLGYPWPTEINTNIFWQYTYNIIRHNDPLDNSLNQLL